MTSDFMPIPELGSTYIKPNGDLIKVTNFYQNLGGVPDYVEYTNLSDGSTGEALMEDWNNLNLQKQDSTRINNNPDAEPEPKPASEHEPGSSFDQEEDKQSSSDSDVTDHESTDQVIDEKLNELSLFLNDEPFTKMPFNVPNRILNFDTTEEIPENEIKEDDVVKEIDSQIQVIRDLREQGRKRKAGRLTEFLWSCAGVDKPLLRMSSQDYAKKAGMGGTILFTAIMAMLSGGYAIYTVFHESDAANYAWVIAIIFGLLWGALIFNLDRYMVNSMYTDGKASISKKEFFSGLPRIIIAILLGIVISTPVELLIFSGKINENIQSHVNTSRIAEVEKVDFSRIDKEIEQNDHDLEKAKAKADKSKAAYDYEVNHGDGGRRAGAGPNARAKLASYQRDSIEVAKYESRRDELSAKKETKVKEANDLGKQTAELDRGLATRISALLQVTAPGSDLFVARLLIMLLFIALEIMPVLNKMMMSSGKYDDWLDQESDLTSRKIRCEEYNLYNVVRSGKLGSYANQIMGNFSKDKHEDGVITTGSEIIESTIDLEKHNFIKENKLRLDKENQEIFMLITSEVSRYLQQKIMKILGTEVLEPQSSPQNNNGDASDDAIQI